MNSLGSLLLVFLAIIPVVLICRYIYAKDKRKEPKKLLLKLFLFGFLSTILTIIITEVLINIIPFFGTDAGYLRDNFLLLFVYVFIGIAIIEEFSKFIFTYWGAYNNKNFDEIYDGIVYCVYVGLGFACLENVLYVIGSAYTDFYSGLSVAMLRGVMAVPGHAFDAIFMGHFFGLAKFYQKRNDKKSERKNLLYAILVPGLLHALYDFGLLTNNTIMIVFVVGLVIFLYIYCIKKVRRVSAADKSIETPSSFCPQCGNKVDSNFCPRCGNKIN